MKGCLATEPVRELETLARLYVESRRQRQRSEPATGRTLILEEMRDAFEKAGVWKLMMQNTSVARYTKPGDPMKFDFAYRVGDSLKIFHAVSLRASIDQAVVLASRYPAIADGINRKDHTTPVLTAIIDDDLDRLNEQTLFALAMMEDATITVKAAEDMPAIAETARRDLRA